jgi:AAA15 family ATPase/GTPase
MLKSLKIENFRCFKSFELQQLGRINLLVGTNNSGKTSILEAIQLLVSRSDFEILEELMLRRGEYTLIEERGGRREIDVKHLFSGHEIAEGSRLSISEINDENSVSIFVDTKKLTREIEEATTDSLAINLVIESSKYGEIRLPISNQGSIYLDLNYVRRFRKDRLTLKTQFVESSSLTTEKMIELFDQINLNEEEKIVVKALQAIEPAIERIGTIASEKYRNLISHSGFIVRLSSNTQRIPIGSMGDGIWRMLGLALAIVNAKDGFLLVDEIDTGLHYTAMTDMWRMIWETAKRLNVQVFATTHSSDCWQSLAEIINEDHHNSEEGITIHRIEKDTQCSIIFNEKQIAIAAKRNLEVR